MPQAVAAVAYQVGLAAMQLAGAAGASINVAANIANVVYAVVEVTAYVGISVGANALFGPKPPGAPEIQTPLKGGFLPRRSGFGRARLSGVWACFEAQEGVSFDVLALHDGRIAGFVQWYLNDDKVDVDPATGGVWCPGDTRKYAYGGPPGDRVFIDYRLGLPTETAIGRVVAGLPGVWTDQHRGDGVATASLVCKQSKDKFQLEDFPNGVPALSVVGDLQLVYDPRNPAQDPHDPDTWAWSDNPFLCLLAYMTTAAGGMGFSYERRFLPAIADWIAAADDCDSAVALAAGGSEKRYRCGGVYMHDSDPAEVLAYIRATCDGWLAQRGDGVFTVRSGRYAAPTVTIRDAQVLGYQLQHFVQDEQAVNELVPSFTDPAADYAPDDAGAWRNEADIAKRGRKRSQPLDLAWVQSRTQARRLAKRGVSRASQELRGQVTTNLSGLQALGERYLKLEILENAALADLVVEVQEPPEIDLAALSVTFSWVAADPNIDAWDPAEEEGEEVTPDPRPTPAPLAAPTITHAEPFYETTGASTLGARLRIFANAPIEADVEWTARWRVEGSGGWAEADYSDVDDGPTVQLETGFVPVDATLEVQVSYFTAGQVSPWSNTFTVPIVITTIEPFLDEADDEFLDENGLRFYPEV
jgi:hypothetical protein